MKETKIVLGLKQELAAAKAECERLRKERNSWQADALLRDNDVASADMNYHNEAKAHCETRKQLEAVRSELNSLQEEDERIIQINSEIIAERDDIAHRLNKEIDENRNYAAETGVLIGALNKQVELNKKLADGFSQALAKAETDITELKTALTTSTEMNKQLQAECSEIERIYRIFTDREPLNDFDAAWAEMEAQGYQYSEDALEQVRFGWHMAQDCLAKWRKDRV